MNIMIDKSEFDILMNRLEGEPILFGSHMYGTATKTSDKDYLCGYEPFDGQEDIMSMFHIPHQLQYKDVENNIDYVFVTPNQAIMNLLSGESTILTDCLLFSKLSDGFLNSDLSDTIFTYKIIKAYVGYAKRDLKQAKEGVHKLKHAARGLYCAQELLKRKHPILEGVRNIINATEVGDRKALEAWQIEITKELKLQFAQDKLKMYPILLEGFEDNSLMVKLLNSLNIKEFKYE